MELVNNLCSWLKRYLWRFTGMSMSNMQSYLNWYRLLHTVLRVTNGSPKGSKTARK
jgi:hypothetical protein